MITREDLTTHWQEIKNRLRQNWRELTESELSRFSGPSSQLISAIQQKTGASWNEIESFLHKVVGDAWSAASQTASTAQRYGKEATQTASHGYDQIATLTANCSRRIVDTVKRRPVETLAIALGVGIAAGAILLISRRRD